MVKSLEQQLISGVETLALGVTLIRLITGLQALKMGFIFSPFRKEQTLLTNELQKLRNYSIPNDDYVRVPEYIFYIFLNMSEIFNTPLGYDKKLLQLAAECNSYQLTMQKKLKI